MRKILLFAVALVISGAGFGLFRTVGLHVLPGTVSTGESDPGAAEAAEKGLSAGRIHPDTGKKIKYWVAPMDPTYIRNEPGKSPMGMDLVPVYEEAGEEKEPASTIRIDPVTIQNMGIRTEKVKQEALFKTIRAFGNVTVDETRRYAVNTKFNGWIETLHVDSVGETVRKGDPLFDIYSPELVTAQEEYLLALEQHRSLGKSDFAPLRESARRLLEASATRLRYWDFPPGHLRRLETDGKVEKTVTVFSPTSGVVMKKNAVEGHYVKAGDHQYDIADLSTVWVDVEIYEYELPHVKKGMPAEMALSYLPGKRFQGKVLFIYPYLNAKSRTARVRLEFSNAEGHLKPDMYANIHLTGEIRGRSVVIPQEAVIDSGVRKVVFISRGKGKFEPRDIELGPEVDGNRYQVLKGLKAGEEIVISAQFMLDSESRLREAIRKMLEVKSAGPKTDASDLDLSGITMEDETPKGPGK